MIVRSREFYFFETFLKLDLLGLICYLSASIYAYQGGGFDGEKNTAFSDFGQYTW
jgi:hypothetical protein